MTRSLSQKLWYEGKDLITRIAHVKYESPILMVFTVLTKVKVLRYVDQMMESGYKCNYMKVKICGMN